MKNYLLLTGFLALILQAKAQTITDVDGNTYNTVTIGTQIWMAENLKTTRYADGTAIPFVSDDSSWAELKDTSKAYCWPNNDIGCKETYGALYNWAGAMNGAASSTSQLIGVQGACPTGWHLPNDQEWLTFEDYLLVNGYNYDGTNTQPNRFGKALATATGWTFCSEIGAIGNTDYPVKINATGFSALPAGMRFSGGTFLTVGSYTYWWTATEFNATDAFIRNLHYYFPFEYRNTYIKTDGFSVRCMKDIITSASILDFSNDKIIYPNPANDRLYIKHDNFSAFVIIFDLQGKQIFNRQISSDFIDISNLSKGVYIVKIINSGNIIVDKLIKN